MEVKSRVYELSRKYQRISNALKLRAELEWEVMENVMKENKFDGVLHYSPLHAELMETLGVEYKKLSDSDKKRYEESLAKECEKYGIVPKGDMRLAEERNAMAVELTEMALPLIKESGVLERHLEEYSRNGCHVDMADAIAEYFG